MVTAVILAAGKSERMGANVDKAFLTLGSKPVLAWSLLAFERCTAIDRIILVVRREQQTAAKALNTMFGIHKLSKIVVGGLRRQDSVMCALKECDPDTRIVVVHDGARPLITPPVIAETVKLAKQTGAAIVGRRIWDTVKHAGKNGVVESTLDRSKLWAVQTPQAFSFPLLQKAYELAKARKITVTDDSAAVELVEGRQVKIYESLLPNVKITTPEDLPLADAILATMKI